MRAKHQNFSSFYYHHKPLEIIFAILAILPFFLIAQTNDLAFRDVPGTPYYQFFSPKDYGAHQQNWDMVQDNNGVLYFANTSGLLSYDGESWQLYNTPNGSLIRTLKTDSTGRIFYGSKDDFGYLSSDSIGQLKLISLRGLVPGKVDNFKDVWEIIIKKGKIFFQTYNHIFILDTNSAPKLSDCTIEWVKTKHRITAFSALEDTIFVYVDDIGLHILKEKKLQLLPKGDFFRDMVVNRVIPHFNKSKHHQHLVVSTKNGLFEWDGVSYRPFETSEALNKLLLSTRITGATFISNDLLAVITAVHGLLIINKHGQLVQSINKTNGFPVNLIYALDFDRQKGLWLGTDAGIVRVDYPSPFSIFDAPYAINKKVRTIEKHRGQLYVGTNSGLYVAPSNPRQPFIRLGGKQNDVFDILSTGEDLLVAFPYHGIHLLEGTKLKKLFGNVPVVLRQSRFDKNLIFVGGGSNFFGFCMLYKVNGKWKRILTNPIIHEEIRYLEETEPGIIWLGSRSNGYIRVELLDLQKNNTPDFNSLQSRDSIAITVNHYPKGLSTGGFRARPYLVNDKMYFASNKGLKQINASSQAIFPDSSLGSKFADTLMSINYIIGGVEGDLWINSTIAEKGVNSFFKLSSSEEIEPQKEATIFARYSNQQLPAMFKDEDSSGKTLFWLGSSEGLIRYDPSIEKDFQEQYNTLIRKVSCISDSTFLVFGGTYDNFENEFPIPNLAYKNNSFRFEFAATNYEMVEQNQFQYFLEGFDNKWSAWTLENKKDYTNLREGEYTFKVRSKNLYGVAGKEAFFSFEILPPWYRSWWAYLLYISSTIGLVGFIVHAYNSWRNKQIEQKNQLLELTIQEKTKEILSFQQQLMVQQKMASLGQMTASIAHEIKNPLNFVNNFAQGSLEILEDLEEEVNHQDIQTPKDVIQRMTPFLDILKQNTTIIQNNGTRMDNIVNSMVNHVRDISTEKSKVDMSNLVDSNVKLAYHGFKTKHPDFEILIEKEYAGPTRFFTVYPSKLGRCIINLLDNACYAVLEKSKRSLPSYQPKVKVTTYVNSERLQIRIWDNGTGISPEVKEKVFTPFFTTKPTGDGNIGMGLSICYDLIVQGHQGSLEVKSEVDVFTAFSIELESNKVEEKLTI